ncbi:MAG: PAS domain S-box protein [Candidatus Thorarchaeota archaeon]|nr:PAS domain S-box protein [Candidatus Thorarchaeota archaeon]MCK5238241.1 PAS domain S-box protein [Candidatus Thorarchaeota archaeon]
MNDNTPNEYVSERGCENQQEWVMKLIRDEVGDMTADRTSEFRKRKIKVLLVEDNLADARLFVEYLTAFGGLDLEFTITQTLSETLTLLKSQSPDIILLDLTLPDSTGLATVRITATAAPRTPIIVLTGHDDFDKALRAIDEGAHDYIVKGKADAEILSRAIRYALRRKESDRALRISEERFKQFFEDAPMYCYMVSEEGKILNVNKSALAALGFTIEEIVGKPVSFLYAEESIQKAMTLFESWKETGFIKNEELVIQTKSREKRMVLLNVVGVRDSDGKVVHSVSIQQDITQRVEAEKNLETERDRTMFYLDLMGHDIRNKLQGIIGGIGAMKEISQDSHFSNLADVALESAEKCSELITKVKKTERLTTVPLEHTHLDEVLIRCLSEFQRDHGDISTISRVQIMDAVILADEFLSDLLTILLNNAVEHNPTSRKCVWVTLGEEDGWYHVSIADNGAGISDSLKELLFDMERRYGGVGLHLAKQIAEKYQGHVEIHDRVKGHPNYGVVFQVWLPKANASI